MARFVFALAATVVFLVAFLGLPRSAEAISCFSALDFWNSTEQTSRTLSTPANFCLRFWPQVGLGMEATQVQLNFSAFVPVGRSVAFFGDYFARSVPIHIINGNGTRTNYTFVLPGVFAIALLATNDSQFIYDFSYRVSGTSTKSVLSLGFYHGIIVTTLLPLVVLCAYRIYVARKNFYARLKGAELNLDPNQIDRTEIVVMSVAMLISAVLFMIAIAF